MFFSYFPIFLFPYLQQIHFEIIICLDEELQSWLGGASVSGSFLVENYDLTNS